MLRILYAGSPEQSAVVLEHLSSHEAEGKYRIVGVLTNPPSCKGRSGKLCPTPVQAAAEMRGIPVFAPEHLGSHERDVIEPLHADLLVCFAYGRIFGPKFMALFPLGGINLHPSLRFQRSGWFRLAEGCSDLEQCCGHRGYCQRG